MSAQPATLNRYLPLWHQTDGDHSRFITDNSARSSHGESLGLVWCPACLADLTDESVIEHIADHDPEAFGLEPVGSEYDGFEPRSVEEIPGGEQ